MPKPRKRVPTRIWAHEHLVSLVKAESPTSRGVSQAIIGCYISLSRDYNTVAIARKINRVIEKLRRLDRVIEDVELGLPAYETAKSLGCTERNVVRDRGVMRQGGAEIVRVLKLHPLDTMFDPLAKYEIEERGLYTRSDMELRAIESKMRSSPYYGETLADRVAELREALGRERNGLKLTKRHERSLRRLGGGTAYFLRYWGPAATKAPYGINGALRPQPDPEKWPYVERMFELVHEGIGAGLRRKSVRAAYAKLHEEFPDVAKPKVVTFRERLRNETYWRFINRLHVRSAKLALGDT